MVVVLVVTSASVVVSRKRVTSVRIRRNDERVKIFIVYAYAYDMFFKFT